LTEDEYQALKKLVAKRAAAGEIGSLPSSARSAGPAIAVSPQSVGSHSSFYAQSEVCCDPPDMSLAVGPKYILQMVNNYVAVYDKSGNLQSGFPKPPTRSSAWLRVPTPQTLAPSTIGTRAATLCWNSPRPTPATPVAAPTLGP